MPATWPAVKQTLQRLSRAPRMLLQSIRPMLDDSGKGLRGEYDFQCTFNIDFMPLLQRLELYTVRIIAVTADQIKARAPRATGALDHLVGRKLGCYNDHVTRSSKQHSRVRQCYIDQHCLDR
jgi:hypothetical protein